MINLKSSVFFAILWSFATRMSLKLLGLASTIILARLLEPGDFGLMALAMSFYAIVDLLGAFGLDIALIQKRGMKDSHLNTAWTVKFLVGLISSCVLALSAHQVAAFYNEPGLVELLHCIAVVFFLNGLTNIGIVVFQKELDFKKEYIFQMSSKIISFITTIFLAYCLRSYWALVIGFIVNQMSTVVISYMISSYRPKVSFYKAKELFSFSGWIFINEWIRFINNRVSELVIGKLLNPASVGIYKIGEEFGSLPFAEITASINRASLPGYSKAQTDMEQLKSLFFDIQATISLVSLPASVGLYIIAPTFVPWVLGEKWLLSIPILQSIALASAFLSFSSNTSYVFLALGRPGLSTFLGLLRVSLFFPLLMVMTKSDGAQGAADALFYTAIVMTVLPILVVSRIVGIQITEYFKAISSGICGALAMLLVNQFAVTATAFGGAPGFLALSSEILCYGGVFCIVVLSLWLIKGKPDGLESKALRFIKEYRHSS
ncbi:MAG: hypothetical protein CSB48_10230 [Proteobacteria bacterium]|nr:MAG: hypothetical protein CSB48_10230 [Pseudomonadota bacterium]